MVTCQRNPEVDNAAARDLNRASALTPIGGHVMRSGIIAITLHLLGSMILVVSLLHAQVVSLPLISNSEMEYQLGIKRIKSASRWYRPLYATLFPTLLTSFGILISPFLWPYMKTWWLFSL